MVYEDESVVVVDKPASWPVHPCGNYRLNSLLYSLGREQGYRNLRPIHRLDKVWLGWVGVEPETFFVWSLIGM